MGVLLLIVSGLSLVAGSVGANQPPRIVSGELSFTKQIVATNVKQVHAVVAADFNNDGICDLAATNFIDGTILQYRGDGSGGYLTLVLDNTLAGVCIPPR